MTTRPETYSVGWDVGAWNCDKNSKSRDAIVILDNTLAIVGRPWRGNLRRSVAAAATAVDWVKELFAKCAAPYPGHTPTVTMAIDTPLGFSEQLIALITQQGCVEPDETSGRNHYLFRQTERHLFERGSRPLSAIKDMLGSQATKGMHALAKFARQVESRGVWTDGHSFHAIEAYPAACRDEVRVRATLANHEPLDHADMNDARICAVIAHLFATDRDALEPPGYEVPIREGWIWVPRQPPDDRNA